MSSGKMNKKPDWIILGERLKKARESIGLSQGDFAAGLGIQTYRPISNIEVGATELKPKLAKLIQHTFKINQNWLLTGEGPMKIEAQANEVAKGEPITESINQEEKKLLLEQTDRILESKTSYRPALAANIRAFHKAVEQEEEMGELKEEMRAMRVEHKIDRERMERMEKMLESLTDQIPEKKSLSS
jgi:transcriptional regulator with XRE-family HTH domain